MICHDCNGTGTRADAIGQHWPCTGCGGYGRQHQVVPDPQPAQELALGEALHHELSRWADDGGRDHESEVG